MAIVGSSGSGKSTLLHLLGGLDTPTSGDVIFNGQPMSKLSSQRKLNCATRSWALFISFTTCCPDFNRPGNVAMPLLNWQRKARLKSTAVTLEDVKAVGWNHRAKSPPI